MCRLSLPMWTIPALFILVPNGLGQESKPAPPPTWLQRCISAGRTHETKKIEAPAPAPPQPTAALLMMNPKQAEAFRLAEEEKWLRRAKVCDKLRELAVQTGDSDLLRKADYLDQRAFQTYLQRTGQTPEMNPAVATETDVNYIEQYRRSVARPNPDFARPQTERRVRANEEEEP